MKRVLMTSPDGSLRRTRGLRALVVGATLLAATAAGTGTYALWSDALTKDDVTVAHGAQVGIFVQRVGSAPQIASSASDVLTFDLTVDDAKTMMAAPTRSFAQLVKIGLRADGRVGIDYSIALPDFSTGSAQGTLFDASTVRLFAVSGEDDATAAAACTVANAPAVQPDLTNNVGLDSLDTTHRERTVYYCLTAAYSGTGGTYQNTGKASAAEGAAEGQDTWSAYVAEPGVFSVTHTVRLPS